MSSTGSGRLPQPVAERNPSVHPGAGEGDRRHPFPIECIVKEGQNFRARQRPVVDPGATQYYLDAREVPVTVKSSISLTDEQHAFARALVEAGRYSSVSAVLQQGVDLLRRRIDAEELETAALRELLSRRRQGGFVDAKGMDARLAGMVAGKRRAHGLPS